MNIKLKDVLKIGIICSVISYIGAFIFFHRKSSQIKFIVNQEFAYYLTSKEYQEIMKKASKRLKIKLEGAYLGIYFTFVHLNEEEHKEFRNLYADIVY